MAAASACRQKISKERLEELYRQYNQRRFVHPDPLEFLYHYEDLLDREIVGFVASSLAYGRVAHILKSVSSVLERMVPTPSIFLKRSSLKTIHIPFQASSTALPTARSFAPCYLL